MARSPTLLLAFNGPLLPLCFVVIAPQFVSCHSPRALDARRRAQMEAAGDRQDILAIDGNCKLHRRTCGMPFAEVIASPYLNKLLLRGCSAMPHGRDTLCCKHAGDRDRPQQPRAEQVGRHRLKRALHSQGDVCHLEIQMQGHGGWQPACTVKEEALAKYFASQADRNIRRRKGAES